MKITALKLSKKLIASLIICALALSMCFSMAACDNNENNQESSNSSEISDNSEQTESSDESSDESPKPDEGSKPDKSEAEIIEASKTDTSDLNTAYESVITVPDSSNSEYTLKILTTADIDEYGMIPSEGSSEWMVTVENPNGEVFDLVSREQVQNGKYNTYAYWDFEDESLKVILILRTNTQINYSVAVYNQENNTFEKTELIGSDNVSQLDDGSI